MNDARDATASVERAGEPTMAEADHEGWNRRYAAGRGCGRPSRTAFLYSALTLAVVFALWLLAHRQIALGVLALVLIGRRRARLFLTSPGTVLARPTAPPSLQQLPHRPSSGPESPE